MVLAEIACLSDEEPVKQEVKSELEVKQEDDKQNLETVKRKVKEEKKTAPKKKTTVFNPGRVRGTIAKLLQCNCRCKSKRNCLKQFIGQTDPIFRIRQRLASLRKQDADNEAQVVSRFHQTVRELISSCIYI